MFTGIDHVAIVVNELESAIASYSRAGFTVVRGGNHPIGTHNALIAFNDGSYFELIAFLKPNTGHPWQKALEKGSGIVDFCMCTDDLAADIDAIRRAGANIGDPSPLTRDRPDGYHLSGHDQPLLCARTRASRRAGPAPRSRGAGVSFTIGPNQVQLLASKTETGPLAKWIRDHGQSPFEVVLANTDSNATTFDSGLLQGARIRFG